VRHGVLPEEDRTSLPTARERRPWSSLERRYPLPAGLRKKFRFAIASGGLAW
jgi:hypothetical protein